MGGFVAAGLFAAKNRTCPITYGAKHCSLLASHIYVLLKSRSDNNTWSPVALQREGAPPTRVL